jgi:hypothetical protein
MPLHVALATPCVPQAVAGSSCSTVLQQSAHWQQQQQQHYRATNQPLVCKHIAFHTATRAPAAGGWHNVTSCSKRQR